LREDVAEPGEIDRLVAVPPQQALLPRAEPGQRNPELLELADRLEERAAADRVEQRVADVGDLRGSRDTVAPAERLCVELERALRFAEAPPPRRRRPPPRGR
jgi:hypothetical protein